MKYRFNIYYTNKWLEEVDYEAESEKEAFDCAVQEAMDELRVEREVCEHNGEHKRGGDDDETD